MKINFSRKHSPTDHVEIKRATAYMFTETECIIFGLDGVIVTISENELEDFWMNTDD